MTKKRNAKQLFSIFRMFSYLEREQMLTFYLFTKVSIIYDYNCTWIIDVCNIISFVLNFDVFSSDVDEKGVSHVDIKVKNIGCTYYKYNNI